MKISRSIYLFALFAVAAAVRYWGIWWGAPARIDLHPDEMDYVMKHALLVLDKVTAVLRGDAPFTKDTLDPVFLNYPAFLMYMTAGVYALLHKIGLLAGGAWQAYLVGRFISATFGAATCIVAFLIAEELGASLTGAALAALWMALMPLHVWESHVAVTDVLMTFWVAVTLWASVRLLRTGRWRDYLLAGVALGLSVGSKYTAAIVVVSVVIGAFASGRPRSHTVRGLALAGVVSLLCCFLVTPYSFIRLRDLLAAMAYEHQHTIGHHIGFSLPARGPQFHKYIYQLAAAWPFSLGLALYACVAVGTVWAAIRMDRRRLVLFGFAVVFFGITGHWTFTPLRYYLPVLLVGVIFAGLWLGEWLESAIPWRRGCAVAATLATVLYTGIFTYQTTARYTNETRMEAGRWMDARLAKGGSVLNCGWSRYMALPASTNVIHVINGDERSFWKLDRTTHYDLIQITSLLYDRQYRHDNKPYEEAYNRLRDPAGEFLLAKRFESSFINKRFYEKLDPMFEGYFVSPTIELYAPKK